MFCDKANCHYGSSNAIFKVGGDGKWKCPQCGNVCVPLNRRPFPDKGRTLHGKGSSEKVSSRKFAFNQKGGSDTDAPATEATPVPVQVSHAKPVSAQQAPVEQPVVSTPA